MVVSEKDNKPFNAEPEFYINEMKEVLINDMMQAGVSADRINSLAEKVIQERIKGERFVDEVTGYQDSTYLHLTLERAWAEYQATSRNFVFAVAESTSPHGYNPFKHDMMENGTIYLQAITDIIKRTLKEHLANVAFFVHYYPEKWAILAWDTDKIIVENALALAMSRVKQYLVEQELDKRCLPNSDADMGIGLYYGVISMNAVNSVRDLVDEACRKIHLHYKSWFMN